MADLDQAVPMQSPMPILVCSSLLAMIHLTRKCTYHHRWTPMRNWVKLQVQISLKAKYNQYIDPYSLFFQAGLLNKLMHNMGSPFTNTVMPQQLMGDKISSSNTFSRTKIEYFSICSSLRVQLLNSLRPRYFHSRMIPIAGCQIF